MLPVRPILVLVGPTRDYGVGIYNSLPFVFEGCTYCFKYFINQMGNKICLGGWDMLVVTKSKSV